MKSKTNLIKLIPLNGLSSSELLRSYIDSGILLSSQDFLTKITEFSESIVKTNKKIEYYNVAASFDIETSSFMYNDQKMNIAYEWTFAVDCYVTCGRTWEEFENFIEELIKVLSLSKDRRLIVYVHNLAYEFQYMRKRFDWNRIFSLDKRKPVVALTTGGIEFRCSYKLSGYSLAKLSDQLTKYKIKKLAGDLDYYKVRHSKTPLTDEEWCYCINDVLVINAYIQELIEHNKNNISYIPMTKTGFVRNYCRNACYRTDKSISKYNDKYVEYRELMKYLTIDEETYLQLKKAFAGGFTHASPIHVTDIIKNVKSYDFTSSYPYVMCSEKFPMSPPKVVVVKSQDDLTKYINHYCCLFDVQFVDIEPLVWYEHYISVSKCWGVLNPEVSNGRIVKAKKLNMTITEQDFFIIQKIYKWKECRIGKFRIFEKGYLPKDLVKSVLDLYVKKTELKDIAGKESEYMRSKEDINSCYGMTATDICREEIKYDNDEWSATKPVISEAIEKNNKSIKRFLYYPWGVWITAYARRNLFTGIVEFGDDYVYSDTDSIKVLNYEKHESYITAYNDHVILKLKTALDHHKLDFSLTCPKNKKGEVKQLGIWEDEGVYEKFKTIGAKRYMVIKNGKLSMTVAGINKNKCIPYLQYTYGDNVFEAFNDGLYIPPETYVNGEIIYPTGKLTYTYIDFEQEGYIMDYLGEVEHFHELSSIHMEPADYDFSMTKEYINFILGVKERLYD